MRWTAIRHAWMAWTGVLCVLSSLGACSAIQEPGQELPEWRSDFHARDGFFVGARASRTGLGGDFDGGTSLVGPDVISIPKAGTGDGRTYSVGHLRHGEALEMTFREVDYGAARYRNLAFNALRYYQAGDALQPYYLLGGVFPWLRLEDAAAAMGQVGDAKITGGIGIQSGLGVTYYLDPRLSIDLRALLSWQTFSRAEGLSGDAEEIDDNLRGLGWSLSFGITLGVLPTR